MPWAQPLQFGSTLGSAHLSCGNIFFQVVPPLRPWHNVIALSRVATPRQVGWVTRLFGSDRFHLFDQLQILVEILALKSG